MTKRQSFFKALSNPAAPGFTQQRQQQEMERAVSDTQWLRERGISPGAAPGQWRPMGMGDRLERAIRRISSGRVKTCKGCRNRKRWLNRLFKGAA